MLKRENEITFLSNPITILGAKVEVGQKAPDFKLIDNGLGTKSLADFAGKVKVLSVVPSLDTGVCDAATRWFNQNVTALGEDVVVLTISMDLPFAQKRWCGAAGIENVVTLSDYQTGNFGTDYGFLIEGLRLLTRGVVVIDKDDTIRYVEYVPEVTQQVNFDAVTELVKSL